MCPLFYFRQKSCILINHTTLCESASAKNSGIPGLFEFAAFARGTRALDRFLSSNTSSADRFGFLTT